MEGQMRRSGLLSTSRPILDAFIGQGYRIVRGLSQGHCQFFPLIRRGLSADRYSRLGGILRRKTCYIQSCHNTFSSTPSLSGSRSISMAERITRPEFELALGVGTTRHRIRHICTCFAAVRGPFRGNFASPPPFSRAPSPDKVRSTATISGYVW